MNQTVILGGLIAIVSGLLWRKLDGMDKSIEKISDSLSDHKGDFREFKGKVEALLGMKASTARGGKAEMLDVIEHAMKEKA
jgi:hypothetical protein